MELERILKELKNYDGNILNIYMYGSKVYGTDNESSDDDYIVIVEGDKGESNELRTEGIDISIYDEKKFKELLEEHEISAIECISLNDEKIILERRKFDFILDKNKLRQSISTKASNSWVKAKKKILVKEDYQPYIAKKSLFHSLKIILYGIQIAENGKIVDFTVANKMYHDILDLNMDDWESVQKRYQPIYNELKSTFKKVCPK